jgi:hypothetical protein
MSLLAIRLIETLQKRLTSENLRTRGLSPSLRSIDQLAPRSITLRMWDFSFIGIEIKKVERYSDEIDPASSPIDIVLI